MVLCTWTLPYFWVKKGAVKKIGCSTLERVPPERVRINKRLSEKIWVLTAR